MGSSVSRSFSRLRLSSSRTGGGRTTRVLLSSCRAAHCLNNTDVFGVVVCLRESDLGCASEEPAQRVIQQFAYCSLKAISELRIHEG
jgi:hypothetical protein